MNWFEATSDGILLRIFVQPKASRSEWVGVYGEGNDARMKVRIAAPPVDGEANAEVIRFVRKSLKPAGVRSVALLRGESDRRKDILLVGGSPDAVRALIDAPNK